MKEKKNEGLNDRRRKQRRERRKNENVERKGRREQAMNEVEAKEEGK
jgi:hypothetical protein